ncbi:MAG: hypothetical protein HGB10_02800 [Coriobacteriia bacterium]|nr:hypothetical protein [Coriobacteriia bacterium]
MADMDAGTIAVETVFPFPWWVALLQGLAALGIGIFLVLQPLVTTVVLVTFLGWYWLVSGFFTFGSLFVDRTQWGWRVASGLLSIVAGGYIIGAPYMGAAVVVGTATLILGINGMIIGAVDIAKAFKGGGWGIGILGALSLVIGTVIAFNFTTYMLALPWIWGLFAIVSGVMGILGAFQLKKAQSA